MSKRPIIHHIIISHLEDVLRISKLENCNFSEIVRTDKYPTNEREANEFIKRRVRLYNESWVIGPLERIIEQLNEINEKYIKK